MATMALRTLSFGTIFIVEHDIAIRDLLSADLTAAGYRVTAFVDAASFLLEARTKMPAAVLIDLHLPDRSGLDVVRDIDAPRYLAPILILTARNEIAYAVQAVKSGAYGHLLKPLDSRAVISRVGDAIATFAKRRANAGLTNRRSQVRIGQRRLTPREREVLSLIAAGASNKEAGRRLGISPRTVEVHRARIMEKIGARNAADLVRIVLGGNSRPRTAPADVRA